MEKIINDIDSVINSYRERAQNICDEYWLVFKTKNRAFQNAGELENIGKIAPRIKQCSNPERHRIIWSVFAQSKKNSKQKGWAKNDLKPTQRGYKEATFRKAGAHPWELKLATQYEARLEKHRYALDKLHESKKNLVALHRTEQ